MTITRIGAGLTLLVGLAFALFGWLSYRAGQAEYRDWVAARGELVGTRTAFDATLGYHYYPRVRFTPAGQAERVAEVSFWTDRWSSEGPVDLFYDRRDPRRVALDYSLRQRRDSGKNGIIGGGAFAAFGLLGLLFGGRRREPRARSR